VVIGDLDDPSDSVREIEAAGGQAIATTTDVTDYAQVEELMAAAVAAFGGIDVVCDNAGVGSAGSLADIDPDAVSDLFEVNVTGLVNVVRASAAHLKNSVQQRGSAYLLITGSEHSLGVPPHVMPMSAYTISKAAALALAETAHRDFPDVGVSLLAPGWVRTAKVRDLMAAHPQLAAAIEPYAQEPEEVARAGFDGLLAGRAVIVTNAESRKFATARLRALLDELE
jgi:NAD(P)-dependent dehydrogenase (short-subunit alcohol dehydrogenase family)